MDDTHPEVITVSVGGKDRRLKLGPSALRLAEMAGSPITQAELGDLGLATLSRLAWAAMLPDDPDLSERDVMVMLAQSDNEAEIIASVTVLVRRMMEDLDKAVSGDAKKKRTRKK